MDLTRQSEERGEELDAARAANREMITQLNAASRGNAPARDASGDRVPAGSGHSTRPVARRTAREVVNKVNEGHAHPR